jgi:hypothetical protein
MIESEKKSIKFSRLSAISKTSVQSFHLLDILKSIFIVSLPHLALFVIFLIYLLIGTSIIQEIDIENKNSNVIYHKTKKVDKIIYLNKFNEVLDNYENRMFEMLNLTYGNINISEINIDSEHNKAFKFLKRLVKSHKKNVYIEIYNNTDENAHISYSKRLIKSFLEYKQEMQLNLNKYLYKLVKKETGSLKEKFNLELDNEDEYVCENDKKEDENVMKFRNSIYFALTLLTTIGYGDFSPVTPIGKIFTSIYSFIGIPFTLIFLSDVGLIFTKFIKFQYILIIDLYEIGYFSSIKNLLIKIINKLITNKKSKEENEDQNEEEKDQKEKEEFLSITHIIKHCYEKSDDTFDFSLLVLTFLILIYLTLGAIIFARNQNKTAYIDIIDYYYFNIISLLKIGIGDLTINLKNSSTTYLTIFYIYIIIGISFFLMIIDSLRSNLKLILIKTGHNIIFEVLKFANQLGYNIEFHINDEIPPAANINDVTSNTSALSNNNNNDDVFYQNNQQNQSSNKFKSNFKIATNIQNKRKNLLKDLNELNGYDNLKCDKQTQITTLLCSKYQNELTNIVEPIVKINSTIDNQILPVIEKEKVNELANNSSNPTHLNANSETTQKQSSPLNTRRTRFENKNT